MSKWFRKEEFACRCGNSSCNAPMPTEKLMTMLDSVRESVGRPVVITSGVRCRDHNDTVGGVRGSEHMSGEGADIACGNSRERFEIIGAALGAGFNRIGIARTFIHLGVSESKVQSVAWVY